MTESKSGSIYFDQFVCDLPFNRKVWILHVIHLQTLYLYSQQKLSSDIFNVTGIVVLVSEKCQK